jgi:cysteine protease ATG4
MNGDLGRYAQRMVQMLWDPELTYDTSSKQPIWCLGKPYKDHEKTASSPNPSPAAQQITPPSSTASSVESGVSIIAKTSEDGGFPPAFLDDFESRVWMTYRSSFPMIQRSSDPKATADMSLSVRLRSRLEPSGFTSDTGWGCMIRSGQSVLANSLVMVRLGRGKPYSYPRRARTKCYIDWRRGSSIQEERKVVSLFADDPKAPYSIHKFVEHGAAACGKYPGQWFGPSATAHCIQ